MKLFMLLTLCWMPFVTSLKLCELEKRGDITIGFLLSMRGPSVNGSQLCSPGAYRLSSLSFVEDSIRAVSNINDNSDLLSGLKLGYVVLDACRSSSVTLLQTLHFLPLSGVKNPFDLNTTIPHYPVDIVVGPDTSETCLSSASLLEPFRIPQISPTCTLDDLSDDKFSYFFRMMPPDLVQMRAIVELLKTFSWTYTVLLFEDGLYGRGCLKGFYRSNRQWFDGQICVAEPIPVDDTTDFDRVVRKIARIPDLKIIVLFVYHQQSKLFLEALARANLTGHYILMYSEHAQKVDFFVGVQHLAVNVLSTSIVVLSETEDTDMGPIEPDGYECLEELKRGACSYATKLLKSTASDIGTTFCNHKDAAVRSRSRKELYYEAVETAARAIDLVIKKFCPSASRNRDLLKNCLTGERIRARIQEVAFRRETRRVAFDENRNLKNPKFAFRYYDHRKKSWSDIGYWFRGRLTFAFGLILPRMLKSKWTCGEPCLNNTIRAKKRNCCWNCEHCPINAIAIDQSRCQTCPLFTWPDLTNQTHIHCKILPPVYHDWNNPRSVTKIFFCCIGLICCLVSSILVIKLRERSKLMKASSPPLCLLIVFGCVIGYVSVLVSIGVPKTDQCIVSWFFYHLSTTVIYGALLIKTNRLFRIFRASSQYRRAKWGEIKFQILFISITVLLQALILSIVLYFYPMRAKSMMPSRTDPYVELVCMQDQVGYGPPLGFNCCLLVICCYMAFHTRKTADNFNESFHIFLIALLTIFIWLAYAPTFFLLNRANDYLFVEKLCLLLHCSVVLGVLFLPKFYAIYFLEDTEKLIYLRDPDTGLTYTARKEMAALRDDRNVVEVSLRNSGRGRSCTPMSITTSPDTPVTEI